MRYRSSPPRVTACLALLAVLAPGCASWHSIGKETPAVYVARERPDVVRFSVGDSSLVLSRPDVRGDSVIGLCKSVHPHRWAGVRGDQIREMEIHSARGTTRGKIVAATIVASGVAIAVLAALSSRSKGIP
jgi:hypothetical protein